MFRSLRKGRVISDERFDSIYQAEFRTPSSRHWTPVEVAITAATLLVEDSSARILDVGSGVGKFCHIGAAVTSGQFFGIERRAALVAAAQDISAKQGIKRTTFSVGDVFDVDWTTFSGIYLYNPFYENIDPEQPIDSQQTIDRDVYLQAIQRVEHILEDMPVGIKVVTYHGFGGVMPRAYKEYFSCRHGGGHIRAWKKITA